MNKPPQTMADEASTAEDTPATIDVLANDSDPEGEPLRLSAGIVATNGTASRTDDQKIFFTPAPNFHGEAELSYSVSDGRLRVNRRLVVTVTPVNDPPEALAMELQAGRNGGSVVLGGRDIEGDRLTFEIASQPSHGTLSGDAPALFYTPDDGFSGADSFSFAVSDGQLLSEAATVSIDVLPSAAPVAEPISLSTLEDSPVDVTLAGFDDDGDELTFQVTQEPEHGVLQGTPPNLVYIPAGDFSGFDSFEYIASDGVLASSPARVSINVMPVGDTPVAHAVTASTPEDTTVTITLTGVDADDDLLSFRIDSAPAVGTARMLSASRVRYQPPYNFNGEVTFTVVASDGTSSSDPATVTVDVTPVNDRPVVRAWSVSGDEDSSIAITLTGTDVDGDSLEYTVKTSPSSGVLSGTSPNLTYTPNPDFNGSDRLTFVASDGTAESSEATVAITVAAINDAPTVAPMTVVTDEDEPLSFTLAASDVDGDTLRFSVDGTTAAGIITGAGPTFRFSPRSNVTGTSTATIEVSDGTLSTEAEVTFVIEPVADDPTVVDDNVQTEVDVAVEIDALSNDWDADDDEIEISAVGTASSGTATLTNDGTVHYQPSAGFEGTDVVIYTVEDATGLEATGTIRIGVGRFPEGVVNGVGLHTGTSLTSRPAISADGRFVASLSMSETRVYVTDRIDGAIELVSTAPDGSVAEGRYSFARISADGRYVSFISDSPDLVPGDDNGAKDLFVHDRTTGETTMVTRASDGSPANGDTTRADISADGRYLVFDSRAFNLVADDFNGALDVFMHDRETGETRRLSVDSNGLEGDGASAGGRISSDGTTAVFVSTATDLVPEDTNAVNDVFVVEIATGAIERVSVSSSGGESNGHSAWPRLSSDGRFVGFVSEGTNLAPGGSNQRNLYVHDRVTDNTQLASVDSRGRDMGAIADFAISGDGRYVLFVRPRSSGGEQLFIRDRFAGTQGEAFVLVHGRTYGRRLAFAVMSTDASYLVTASTTVNRFAILPNPLR